MGLFEPLRALMRRWLQPPASAPSTATAVVASAQPPDTAHNGPPPGSVVAEGGRAAPVPYDEHLLEKARTQWQFGDWESLARLDRDQLQHHPDRAKLALLAAEGRLQVGYAAAARYYLRLAREWGCSEQLIRRVIIAGVHNSLGRAAALAGQAERARLHFEGSVKVGMPSGEARLVTQARIQYQSEALGLEAPARPASPGLRSLARD